EMQRNVLHAESGIVVRRTGKALDRLWQQPRCACRPLQQAQPDATLHDQQVSTGKEFDRERSGKSLGQYTDLDPVLLGRVEDVRLGAQRRRLDSDGGWLLGGD